MRTLGDRQIERTLSYDCTHRSFPMNKPATTAPDKNVTRASSPTQAHAYRDGPRITAVETVIPDDIMPGLLLLRIHTDAGAVDGDPVIGHGESYYAPHAVAAMLHDWMSRRLLG